MDPTRFDRLARALASRRSLLGGAGATLAGLLGHLALGEAGTGAAQGKPKPKPKGKCKAVGRLCSGNGECCSKSCFPSEGPDGRRRGRKRCLCPDSLNLPCGGRCCARKQTCKRGRCIHHCKDGRISANESDRDCGGSDCPKCGRFALCNRPSDCETGRCAPLQAFQQAFGDGRPRCVDCTADLDCRNPTPRCFFGSDDPGFGGICVECRIDGHCPQERRRCRLGKCVECTENAHCPQERPFCTTDLGAERCVECLDELHCQDGELCESGTCVGEPSCFNSIRDGDETDTDCGGPTCSRRCTERLACLVDSDCASKRCVTSDQCFGGVGLCCQPCSLDADCASGTCLGGGVCA